MISLEAIGSTETMECVHISLRSIVCTMRGPRICNLKSGSCKVRAVPASPPAMKIANANAQYRKFRLKIRGYSYLKNFRIAQGLARCPA